MSRSFQSLELFEDSTVLDFGLKIAEGSPEAIRRDPTVIAADLGQSEQAPAEVSLEVAAEAERTLEVTS